MSCDIYQLAPGNVLLAKTNSHDGEFGSKKRRPYGYDYLAAKVTCGRTPAAHRNQE